MAMSSTEGVLAHVIQLLGRKWRKNEKRKDITPQCRTGRDLSKATGAEVDKRRNGGHKCRLCCIKQS